MHRGSNLKYDSPFEVVKRVSKIAYRLKLSERLRVHPTFHVISKAFNGDDKE